MMHYAFVATAVSIFLSCDGEDVVLRCFGRGFLWRLRATAVARNRHKNPRPNPQNISTPCLLSIALPVVIFIRRPRTSESLEGWT